MQTGTKPRAATSCNSQIDNLSSMRLSAEPWRWSDAILAADLTAGTKVAAFALLKFVNRKDGRAFASEETIAKACGMTERGVRAAIAALKAAGFVRVVRRGRMQSNLVYLALPVTGTVGQVTGMDAQSDRHDHDKVTGMAMPPNLRIEPLKEPQRNNLPERPSSELTVVGTAELSFDGKEVDGFEKPDRAEDSIDHLLPRVGDEHVAYCRISRAAINLLGWSVDSCPKLPDGRYADRAIWDALPEQTRSRLTQKAMKGRLMLSEVAEAIRSLPIAQAYQPAVLLEAGLSA